MVLAMWRLRKLREENEQKLELAVKAAREETRIEVREEERKKARKEERQRWEEWARQVQEDVNAGRPIKEPPSFEDE